VLVTAYVDESGTGGQAKVMLGALISRAIRWHRFHRDWQQLLDSERVEFSHLVAMETREPPFENWGKLRTSTFVARAIDPITKNVDFGMTSALSREDYQHHYRTKLSERAHKDSQYGLSARALIDGVSREACAVYGNDIRINFIFEDSHHFQEAKRVFDELRDYVSSVGRYLGTIRPGLKREFGALQAADILASLGRRSEPTANFTSDIDWGVTAKTRGSDFRPIHLPLGPAALASFRDQAEAICLERRGRRRARNLEKRHAAQDS
jgi:hypothetical protein